MLEILLVVSKEHRPARDLENTCWTVFSRYVRLDISRFNALLPLFRL
jgi:hypothetical protein